MTLSNGNTITQADLRTMNQSNYSNLDTLNLFKPSQWLLPFTIVDIGATGSSLNVINSFCPDDFVVREVRLISSNIGVGTLTAKIDTGFMVEPLSISLTTTAINTYQKANTYYGLNNANKKALQTLLKGSPLQITLSTSVVSLNYPNKVEIILVCESRRRRF